MPPLLSTAADLVMLPLRIAKAVASLPSQLSSTTSELQQVRLQLLAARSDAQALQVPAHALIERSEAAIARMDELLEIGPELLQAAGTASSDIRAGLDELQHARAAMADLAGEVPPIAAAARGAAKVERKFGLVD